MTSLSPPHSKYPKPYLFVFLSCLLSIMLISGCQLKQEEELYSKDEAEREFIQICKDEYSWDVGTKLIGNTLWIYIPYQQDLLKFTVNKFPQVSKFSVIFLNGDFKDGDFYFEYHITPLLKSEENKGYTYSLADKVSEDFHYLLNVIYRVYFNAEQQPEFYVLVMADIENGIEVIYTIYGLDLKKAYNNAISGEEYYKRILQDIRGNMAIIQDKVGRHLNYHEKDLAQFLDQQIVQRIRIRFISGDFKLRGTIEEEILEIISYCLRTYEFRNFSKIILRDLSTGAETIRAAWELEEIREF